MARLVLENVDLDFSIYHGTTRSLKRAILDAAAPRNLRALKSGPVVVNALSGIDLDLKDGDRLGLVGANGAGKTTLLKVMAGIYAPQRGHMRVEGKIRALLSPTLGMNLDATGRENIVLLGLHMKIRPAQMRDYLEEIADWSALGPYMDAPVRTYSAGMMARLAFATATCLVPEILLLDEWLNAGDIQFQAKAQKRLEGFVSGARILVLTSHSMPLLETWCNKAVCLDGGKVVGRGTVAQMRAQYERLCGMA